MSQGWGRRCLPDAKTVRSPSCGSQPASPDLRGPPTRGHSKSQTKAGQVRQRVRGPTSNQALAHAEPRLPPIRSDLRAVGAQHRRGGPGQRSNTRQASYYKPGNIHADIRDRGYRTYTLILTMRPGPVLIFSFGPTPTCFDRSSFRALKVIHFPEFLTFSRRRPDGGAGIKSWSPGFCPYVFPMYA